MAHLPAGSRFGRRGEDGQCHGGEETFVQGEEV